MYHFDVLCLKWIKFPISKKNFDLLITSGSKAHEGCQTNQLVILNDTSLPCNAKQMAGKVQITKSKPRWEFKKLQHMPKKYSMQGIWIPEAAAIYFAPNVRHFCFIHHQYFIILFSGSMLSLSRKSECELKKSASENVMEICAQMHRKFTLALCFLPVPKKKRVTELLFTLIAASVYEFDW